MRIIAGSLGGRQFTAPPGHKTHPMSEKARGALFNVLGDIERLSVLDAFAGSGAISFEALSRGASKVVAVDNDRSAAETIKQNAGLLGVSDKIKVIRANVISWSANNPTAQFDLIICDPPYQKDLITVIEKLVVHLGEGGTLVLSQPPNQSPAGIGAFRRQQINNLGDAELAFYKKGI